MVAGSLLKQMRFNSNLTKVQICDVSNCAKISFDNELKVSVED